MYLGWSTCVLHFPRNKKHFQSAEKLPQSIDSIDLLTMADQQCCKYKIHLKKEVTHQLHSLLSSHCKLFCIDSTYCDANLLFQVLTDCLYHLKYSATYCGQWKDV